MWQYIIYFFIGGGIVTLVAYIASRGNLFLATLIGNIPVLFLLNVLLVYRENGVSGSIVYTKGVLLMLPIFILFIAITILLIPRLGMPKAIMMALPIYLILPAVLYHVKKKRKLKSIDSHNHSFEVGHDISDNLNGHGYS